MKICIIKIGNGYFRKFILNSPEMVSDRTKARRLSMGNAKKTRRSLKKIGYKVEIIEVK